jgi:hypothetical protein
MTAAGGLVHICAAGETFDGIALQEYGDESYASELLMANPALDHITEFSGGEVLAVPEIEIPDEDDEEGAAATSAPWKG